MSKSIHIDSADLGVDYQDSGPWRSYELSASGDDYESLIEDATISEVDQDGGEIRSYGIGEAGNKVCGAVERIIKRAIDQANQEHAEAHEDNRVNRAIDEAKEK